MPVLLPRRGGPSHSMRSIALNVRIFSLEDRSTHRSFVTGGPPGWPISGVEKGGRVSEASTGQPQVIDPSNLFIVPSGRNRYVIGPARSFQVKADAPSQAGGSHVRRQRASTGCTRRGGGSALADFGTSLRHSATTNALPGTDLDHERRLLGRQVNGKATGARNRQRPGPSDRRPRAIEVFAAPSGVDDSTSLGVSLC
jgi:hypothetical protein